MNSRRRQNENSPQNTWINQNSIANLTMEYSKEIIQVVLPNNQDKIICNIESSHMQIGDHNKAVVDPRIFGGADKIPNIKRLDLDDIVQTNTNGDPSEVVIEGKIVQVLPRDGIFPDNVPIEVNLSRENSNILIGDKTEFRLKYEDTKAKQFQRSRQRKKRNQKKKEKSVVNETSQQSRESIDLYDKFFREVLAVLHPLRDDGKWDEFDEKLNEFRVKYGGNRVWDILLTLEQGQQLCYHSFESNIEAAERILLQGLGEVKKCKDLDPSIAKLCKGRAYCYLASVYRRVTTLHGKASRYIEEAEKLLNNNNFLYDEASLNYEKASFLLVFDQKGSFTREIKTSLDKCSELCRQINKNEKWEFVKKGYFAKVKKVMLLCDCTTKPARKRRISDEDREEVKKCLEELEEEKRSRRKAPAVSEQIVSFLAKADKEVCDNNLLEAKKFAKEAIALAQTHGFEEQNALKRLQNIESMIGQEFEPAKQETIKNITIVSEDADVSATTDETDD